MIGPHSEETKARMRETHKEVGKRPEIKAIRSKAAFKLWETLGRESVIQAQKDGWKNRRDRIKRERDAKNAAAVAAHLEKFKRPDITVS